MASIVFVLVEEDGKLRARQRIVQTGPVQGDEIAIDKGLAAGELIAAAGSFKLRDGLLVQTTKPGEADAAAGRRRNPPPTEPREPQHAFRSTSSSGGR